LFLRAGAGVNVKSFSHVSKGAFTVWSVSEECGKSLLCPTILHTQYSKLTQQFT